jgi:hypothetical protein
MLENDLKAKEKIGMWQNFSLNLVGGGLVERN